MKFLCLVLALVLPTALRAAAHHAKPNIILILADDLTYAGIGCYGQKPIQTPQLDRMAAEGMRFTDFDAGHTACVPRASS